MAQDDSRSYVVRRDISGGSNTRQFANVIGENQVATLYNADISVPGESKKRPGLSSLACLSTYSSKFSYGFQPTFGTNELMLINNTNLYGYYANGSLSTYYSSLASLSSNQYSMVKVTENTSAGIQDTLLIYKNFLGWFRMYQNHSLACLGTVSGTGYDSPPLSQASLYYRNRLWVLKNNGLYFSSAIPAINTSLNGYGTAFDTVTNYFNMPVGEEKALLGIRDAGIIAFGGDSIWGINPSSTPVATDKPEKLLNYGCIAPKTAVNVNDDIMFLAKDGVRGLFRTINDKLQGGNSFPMSYVLKTEYDSLNWNYISNSCAIYFDNKYFIAVPTSNSTYNNQVWVYFPALNAWVVITGWNVSSFSTMQVNGEEQLFVTDAITGKLYRGWYGYTDNGTAINYLEEGRKEDCGNSLIKKVGGEVWAKVLSTGNYDIAIYLSLDNGNYNFLGNITTDTTYVTFPTTFPVQFPTSGVTYKKFHIDILGEWYLAQIKLQHNATNTADIKILERGIITNLSEYISEEET